MRSSITRLNQVKSDKTIKMLGYSANKLKEHMESLWTTDMNWENYGEWHIDHIRPVCTFNSDTPSQVVNSLSNLRPLWATTRMINGVIYEGNLNRSHRGDL